MIEYIHRCNKEDDITQIKDTLKEHSKNIRDVREKLYNGMDQRLERIDRAVEDLRKVSESRQGWRGALWRFAGTMLIAMVVGAMISIMLYVMAMSASAAGLAEFLGAILSRAIK